MALTGSATQRKLITSSANAWVKEIRALRQRKYREARGAYFVEGIRPVWQALASGEKVEILILAEDLLTSQDAMKMIASHSSRGVPVVRVSGRVFESLARREHPSGLGAVVRISSHTLAGLSVRTSSVFVALLEPGNPGNIGAILRTLDAVGGSGLILIGNGADPYHPASVKASMGALFNIAVVKLGNLSDLLAWCRSEGVNVITTSPAARIAYWAVNYSAPLLLLFGSEGEGLSEEAISRGNSAVRIPMSGTADSLNLAVSVGVILYEVERQRALEPQPIKGTG